MTYQKDQVGIRQTASNAAATLTVAELAAGIIKSHDTAVKRFEEFRDSIFLDLDEKRVADNEMFKAEEAASPAKTAKGGGNRSGGKREQAAGDETGDPGSTVINGKGKFAGLTIAAVFELTAEQAAAYAYTDKEGNAKPGSAYVEWMAGNEKNPFMARKATAFLEAKRAGSDS